MSDKPEMKLWLSDARGQYIPRDFATSFVDRAKHVTGVLDDDWAVLETGPDHDDYWDTWSEVEQNAVITDENGVKYSIYNNGDCWLIPDGMEWSDKEDGFVWPGESEETES